MKTRKAKFRDRDMKIQCPGAGSPVKESLGLIGGRVY
jgi:hypothetical protein